MKNSKRVVGMELWMVYSLLAAFAFGVQIVVYKLGFRQDTNPFLAALIFGVGILLSFALVFAAKNPTLGITPGSAVLVFVSGIIWAAGFLLVTLGVASNFDVSKMSVIYNANFVVAIILGVLVLKELQSTAELVRTVIGAAVVIIGILIVGLK